MMEKALIIKTNPNMDMSDVVQVAKAEGAKLLHSKSYNVKVLDILHSRYGVIAVVRDGGCSVRTKIDEK